ncbi:PREDICTED: mucin-6 isoform X2 [Wasmannia auropunctata]|nr:PREDICTED: mucin-6 isoform X2 [Wasmannia auropunctata]XP_011699037.1 PREDICTED: mucin-6 isoform X2 [Wasmannia auropunctata]XP_011699038.1 PREDICTED: mucin-6 isoform X2 [Wasmannia auropunctata]
MLSQRLRWLLPALIVSWMSLQLGAALPAHDERSHVSANTFDPSSATSTITRQDHDGRAHHPPNGKNETQSSHKLVASPAGLLRPDKFQFYTYDDKGDMITRQMTAQEIQGLIAAGGADHVAMDRQEPQKADDVLTGGKKVMDVVQKVQNVLKSALDKPPTLTGTIPKIPEHANVEWSNILPSILSGETDAISPNSESSQLSHKTTTEKIEAESKHPTKKPATSDVQTNAYAGFTNNMQGKPHHGYHSQQMAATEKPMIPVPVITLTEQKLSTLQSAVTESPVFQIISVIPVESVGIKGADQTDPSTADTSAASSATTHQLLSAHTEGSQTEQYVELALSEVPEDTTFPQLTSLDMYPVSITKQTTTSNKIDQGTKASAIYSMTTPGVSTHSSMVTKQTVTHGGSSELTSATDKISPSNASYVLVQSKNNTKVSDDSSFVSGITKGSQANNGANKITSHNDDKIIPHTNTIATPISHASPKPEAASNETAPPHSPSTLASVTRIKAPTVPTTLHTFTVISDHYLGEGFPTVTKESSSSLVTPTYGANYLNSLPTEIQSSAPIEPLPTQLIDSFSSVINQVSEVKPPVLPLSSPMNETPEIPIANINYSQRRNVSEANRENVRPVINTQTYVTFTTEIPPRDSTTKIDYSVTYRPLSTQVNGGSASTINVPSNSRITASTASTRFGTSNRVTINNSATTPAGLKSTQINAAISGSTASSLVHQFKKTHATTAALPAGQTESPATLQSTANRITPPEKTSSTSAALNAIKTQSTTASIDTNLSSNKPATTNKYFDNTLASLNLSDPVSAIDKILSVASLPSSTPAIEPINLPDNIQNFVLENASDFASSLIAGFAKDNTTVEKLISDQAAKNTSSQYTKLTPESIENINKKYEEMVRVNLNNQKERNVTQSTQETLADPTRNGTLIYGTLTQTKQSNDTLEPTKLSSNNERLDDSAKVPSSSPANKFTNVNGESKDIIRQSATTVGIVTVNPEQTTITTTDVGIRSPVSSINKTTLSTSNNQKRTEIKEKVKAPTEAPIVRTDLNPELSQLSVKIANDAKNSGHAENSPKIEVLDKKNSSFANASLVTSVTKETVAIHSINDSISESSSQVYSNVTTDTSMSNVTSDSAIVSKRNSTNPAFSQTPNRVTSTAGYKDKNNTQNKKDNINESSSPSISEHTDSSIKVMQESTKDASGEKGSISRPVNSVNNTSNQHDKNITQTTSTVNASIQNDGHLNNTENKTVQSLKNFESSPKPDVTRLPASTPPSNVPIRQTSKPAVGHRPSSEKSDVTKTGADVSAEDKWTLISQQTPPAMSKLPKPPKPPKPLRKPVNHVQTSSTLSPSNSPNDQSTHVRSPGVEATAHQQEQQQQSSTQSFLPLDASQSAIGLDVTIRHTSADIVNFAKLCNELAFNFWVATNKGLSTARSLALSPFGMTSLLAMIFLGARGPTSDQMNEVLGLDDVATFNPHLVFQNITDAVGLARGQGIANAAFVRELFADKMKVRKLMPFYKEQAQQFYEGLVTEVNFATISDLVRRRTNLLVRKQTGGRIKDFVKTNTVPLRSPLAALSANVFQTDCNSSLTSSIGRDGELYFAVSPAVRQRKLVPVPATTWRSSVLAGYEPSIDATAVALGGTDKLVSTIFVLPGQQGHTAPGDTLDRLEQRLVRSAFRDGAWNKLLKVLIPRHGLELQVPKFSHRSVVNATAALKRMGLDELFSGNADFKGINGVGHRLHLADVLQMNLFSTCGDENILSGRHHVETYPASPLRRSVGRRMEDDSFGNIEEDTSRYGVLPQEDNIDSYADQSRTNVYGFYREERQLSGSLERPRLKLDRPFLYFVRHNPSGIILHMGRFNPRLLP